MEETEDKNVLWWHRPSIGPKTYFGRDIYWGDRKVAHNVKLEDAEFLVAAGNTLIRDLGDGLRLYMAEMDKQFLRAYSGRRKGKE
tara:strand:- start:174 stop:428 length:255 start_codon:yes stop_codon:yes gene_type:complete